MGFPAKFEIYGFRVAIPNDEAVAYCWDWQVFIKKRMVPVCVGKEEIILNVTDDAGMSI